MKAIMIPHIINFSRNYFFTDEFPKNLQDSYSYKSHDENQINPNEKASVGLLYHVENPEKAKFYSKNINMAKAFELVEDKKYIYRSATQDANDKLLDTSKYIDDINRKANIYMDKSKVWDRRELVSELQKIIQDKGKFICLLGGKSTGKSLILDDLVNRNRGKVILVDLRKHGSILSGLLEELEDKPSIFSEGIRTVILSGIDIVRAKLGVNFSLSSFLSDKPKEEVRLLRFFLEELIIKGSVTTLIIDEANAALTITDNTSKANIENARAMLKLFTFLTKQQKQLNVILVSSEHGFPFRLNHADLAFNTDDFTGFMYAGEVPPDEMFKLLTEEWGVGEQLATALISHYGGHIYDTHNALQRLSEAVINPRFAFQPSHFIKVHKCLHDNTDKPRMIRILKQLAKKGFAPLNMEDDAVAEVISSLNVGGVVQNTGVVVGLSAEFWENSIVGIMPASQSMRLVIADVLHAKSL